MRGSLGFSAMLLTALVAACVPSTFDGLTGGKDKKPIDGLHEATERDESLKGKDPRPISPFSGSWVNTSHPVLTFKLQPGLTETTVELSQARDFVKAKRFKAVGGQFKVPEELAPGVWFWRLQARTESSTGVSYSPIWEVLVRGKSKNATEENPAAHGGFTDQDGDGIPDLNITYTANMPLDPSGTSSEPRADFTMLGTLYGVSQPGQPITFDPFNFENISYWDVGTDAPAIATGFDIDGDGLGDVAVADVWPANHPSADWYAPGGGSAMYVMWGYPWEEKKPGETEPEGDDDDDDDDDGFEETYVVTQSFTQPPALAVGDFNGDGYGDMSAMFSDLALTIQGNPAHSSFTLLPFESPTGTAPSSFLISAGAFDDDAMSDLAYTPFDELAPVRLSQGSPLHYVTKPNLSVGTDIGSTAPLKRATAIATGDFDGDGFDEAAFATVLGDKAAFCVHTIKTTTLSAKACWTSELPIETLGAGDADGDGVDEIFVGRSDGITIVTHEGIGYADETSVFEAFKVANPADGAAYTSRFSVFYPGRPGNAQWAVYGADNKTLYIVDGKGEKGATHYDFTNLKNVKYMNAPTFRHFGTAIR